MVSWRYYRYGSGNVLMPMRLRRRKNFEVFCRTSRQSLEPFFPRFLRTF